MAHTKPNHDYHLVNPSPWPLVVGFALLAFTGGAAMWMHDIMLGGIAIGPMVFSAGVLVVLLGAYSWWRDVVREGLHDHAHTPVVRQGLRLGMGLFIVSEIMFFFAFFWAYFYSALLPKIPLEDIWAMAEGVWPPKGVQTFDPWDLPFLNTLILLLSGTTVTWAHHGLLHGDKKSLVNGLLLTVLLGVSFTTLQAVEYGHAAFGMADGIYPSTFYLATGFHGLHVMIGTAFLAVCLVRAQKNQFTEEHHLGFEFAAWYWHFVDVVWLFLFAFVYVWGA